MTSRLAKQIEAYRMARRIVRACNRMKAGQGPALQWCTQQRHVLHWMMRTVRAGLERRRGVPRRPVTLSINRRIEQ